METDPPLSQAVAIGIVDATNARGFRCGHRSAEEVGRVRQVREVLDIGPVVIETVVDTQDVAVLVVDEVDGLKGREQVLPPVGDFVVGTDLRPDAHFIHEAALGVGADAIVEVTRQESLAAGADARVGQGLLRHHQNAVAVEAQRVLSGRPHHGQVSPGIRHQGGRAASAADHDESGVCVVVLLAEDDTLGDAVDE